MRKLYSQKARLAAYPPVIALLHHCRRNISIFLAAAINMAGADPALGVGALRKGALRSANRVMAEFVSFSCPRHSTVSSPRPQALCSGGVWQALLFVCSEQPHQPTCK